MLRSFLRINAIACERKGTAQLERYVRAGEEKPVQAYHGNNTNTYKGRALECGRQYRESTPFISKANEKAEGVNMPPSFFLISQSIMAAKQK